MNADIFAEWLRRQGHTVIRTESSYWYDAGPRVLQAFPYHRVIEPSEKELRSLLLKYNAFALRYSTALDAPVGKISYHVVCEDPGYGFSSLSRQARQNVRRGMEYASIEPISLSRLANEGWKMRLENMERQGRMGAETEEWWRRLCLSAEGLQGFAAVGAVHDGKLVASFLALRCDDCYTLPFEQSSSAHLQSRVNNAIFYNVTCEAFKLPGISRVFFCLESLDGSPGVDRFKFRMGYTPRPVRQRVVFHPLLSPLLNTRTHGLVRRVVERKPDRPSLSKFEGMLRFYLEGKRPPARQHWPECMVDRKSELLATLMNS